MGIIKYFKSTPKSKTGTQIPRTITTARMVREARSRLNLTQETFAKKIGKARTTVTRYESGAITPPGDIMVKIQSMLEK